jgi:hypothetical protein
MLWLPCGAGNVLYWLSDLWLLRTGSATDVCGKLWCNVVTTTKEVGTLGYKGGQQTKGFRLPNIRLQAFIVVYIRVRGFWFIERRQVINIHRHFGSTCTPPMLSSTCVFAGTNYISHSCETQMTGPIRCTETSVDFNHWRRTVIHSPIFRLLSMRSFDYNNKKANKTNEFMDDSFWAGFISQPLLYNNNNNNNNNHNNNNNKLVKHG